ncbi:glutathione S-transferase N-terminal domain-containing protein [Paraburkholderia sp.]|jgi:glutathione S-transferase|uniref:glutathione S-transferase n=1 Tax=Paraburkholderia sp. TaxID=1926495 RepID=UPI002F41BF07
MKLIGMLDSPYVRRVAICLKLLKLEFEHQSVSVFSTYETFRQIHPVVKAPTLILDDGQALIDSTLILDYVQTLPHSGVALAPQEPAARLRATKLTGLALAACEKTVQIVYERNLRPADKQHEPWVERVRAQLFAACSLLEDELTAAPLPMKADALDQASVTIAVTWRFIQMMLPEIVDASAYPGLRTFSEWAEQQPVFVETPPV